MAYFPFDLSTFDNMPVSDWQEATLAARTAQKLAGYYQDYARAMYTGAELPTQPDFNADEAAIAGQIRGKKEHSFHAPASRTGLAAFKLFYAIQTRFYIEHPSLIAVFGPNARALPHMMAYLSAALPDTWPPVDAYFTETASDAKNLVKHYFPGPGSGRPGPEPSL